MPLDAQAQVAMHGVAHRIDRRDAEGASVVVSGAHVHGALTFRIVRLGPAALRSIRRMTFAAGVLVG